MYGRVVVTGAGAVTSLGNDLSAAWKAIKQGKSGVDRICRFDASSFSTRIAGEVKGFNPSQFVPAATVKQMDRFIQLACAAAKMAHENAFLDLPVNGGDQVGVFIGSGFGGLSSIEECYQVYKERGPRRVTPYFVLRAIPNLASGQVAIMLGARGPNLSHSTACAAGAHSIGEAFRVIREGIARMMFCGGSEATITPLGICGFSAMRALSTRNDEPQAASRPFDRDRDGFVPAEGAGVMVLESLEHAESRGANILAEIKGYAFNGDAHHITAPSPEGAGAVTCMKKALLDAGIEAKDVGYINAHGTSTPYNDRAEAQAIATVFGSTKEGPAISSTKSMTGHMLGATGAVEAIFTVKALQEQVLLPNINLDNPDPQCLELNYNTGKVRESSFQYAISNSFGFGGTNAVLVFKRWQSGKKGL